jgi:hypothetical protein
MLSVVLRFADLYAAEFAGRIAALEVTVEQLTREGRLDEMERARQKREQYELSRSHLLACAQSLRVSLATEAPPDELQLTRAVISTVK